MDNTIYIGCVAVIRNEDSILLGLRQNCYGAGTWGLPGGHLEFRERLVEAVRRELREEISIDVPEQRFRLVSVTDSGLEEGQHHVQVCFEMLYAGENIERNEPDKCEQWRFFPLGALPSDIFPPHKGTLEKYISGDIY